MRIKAFEDVEFADLPGWPGVDPSAALSAFRRSAAKLLDGSVRTGELGVRAEDFAIAAQAALTDEAADPRIFFERHFRPSRIRPETAGGRGFLTGYYEPVVRASSVRTERHTVPLHRRPDDLVPIEPGEAGLSDRSAAFARRDASGVISEYFDRAEIARGALDGRGLEIAWLEDPVDAFFIHVQGSARLELEDGRRLRVGYAAKSGHGFTAIGRILVAEGELVLEKADMAGIRAWLAENPVRVRELLDRNRSYIFFREIAGLEDELGPVGAAGVPLTALSSLALDRELHTWGMPVFVDATGLVIGGEPFRRLAIAQDTGSAILGPARADLFVGTGEAAGRIAGAIRHPADFFALLPRDAAR